MINWQEVKQELESMMERLGSPNLDSQTRATLQKKVSQYSALFSKYQEIQSIAASIVELKEQANEDEELRALFEEEILQQEQARDALQQDLDDLLYPADEHDNRSVFLEIRAGAGGQEAALFAADLFRMYSNYALKKNWQISLVDESFTDIGGYKELVIHIKGKGVYRLLKHESGVHRVQRVPATETQGRVHTSTVTVAVLPEADEVDVQINPQDLRIDTYRAGGAGGQHVNKTDSAVRITHIPTGLVVACQDERSQIKNRAKAMKVLQSRILEAEKERHEAEQSAKRKEQVGGGMRAEKIRTYNFPQNRVSDHRTEVTLKKLDLVMAGDMDDLLQPLMRWELEERRKKGTIFST